MLLLKNSHSTDFEKSKPGSQISFHVLGTLVCFFLLSLPQFSVSQFTTSVQCIILCLVSLLYLVTHVWNFSFIKQNKTKTSSQHLYFSKFDALGKWGTFTYWGGGELGQLHQSHKNNFRWKRVLFTKTFLPPYYWWLLSLVNSLLWPLSFCTT